MREGIGDKEKCPQRREKGDARKTLQEEKAAKNARKEKEKRKNTSIDQLFACTYVL
jgi:hypothetical protein